MILLIDNYDSFTFNLSQAIETIGFQCEVRRNDRITLGEINTLSPEMIVLSPGPGAPISAGITLSVIKKFAPLIPIFGVCLGHQAIGEAFGAKVIRAPKGRHGKLSTITHTSQGAFANLPQGFLATRYHSLVIDEATLSSDLEVTARSDDGLIMGIRHKRYAIQGVQFHPESVATENGLELLRNVLHANMERRAYA